jgi:hypothetical protein
VPLRRRAAPRLDNPANGRTAAAGAPRILRALSSQETEMSRGNVIPFRKRPPSKGELEAFRRMTRSWSPEMRQLMFPRYVAQQNSKPKDQGE